MNIFVSDMFKLPLAATPSVNSVAPIACRAEIAARSA